MSIPSWVRHVFARPAMRPIRKAPRRNRLALETLEDRWVPANFVVNNPTDNPFIGQTNLRQAIAEADATTTNDTITFDAAVFATPQTITLAGTALEISKTTGTITITGSAMGVTVNAGGLSGVLQVDAKVTASISGMTITGGNTGYAVGGGVYNRGTLSMANCTVSGNYGNTGGGFFNAGPLSLINCTVSGNTAVVGAGEYNTYGTSARLINCTVSGNAASLYFGGFAGSTATTVGNTIIAGNTAPQNPDVVGLPHSLGNNLIGITAPLAWVSSDLIGTAAAPVDPHLAPLGNYGGPTETMALLPGSPALGAGNVAVVPPGISTDQRGQPRLLNGKVDIGAFESQGFTLSVVAGSTPQSAAIGTAFPNPLGVQVTANNPIEPVDGGVVTFVAVPASNGASAIFSASTAVIASGQASITAAPNNSTGEYQVNAAVSGLSGSFDLTNTGTPFTNLIVNTTADSLAPGAHILSLREAIGFANSDTTGNATITFDPSTFGGAQTITLTLGTLELTNLTETETVTDSVGALTLSGGGTSGVFLIDGGVTASISGMTVTDGKAAVGGGISNYGALTLADCTISGSSATVGGGFYNGANATATLTNCTVSGNTGTYGGGLYVYGTITLTNCTVSGNTSLQGGGLSIGANSTATLTSSTISGNSSTYGGGILNFGALNLNQSTVADNAATGAGGGIYSLYGTTTTLGNTIVAGNTSGGPADIIGSITSLGNNLIGNASNSTGWVSSDLTGTAAAPINPLLAPLGNYGGPTETMPLLPGSPGIAAGNVSLIPGGTTTDQRGEPRLLDGTVDIGAFESQGFTITVVPGSTPQSADIGTTFTNPLAVTVTANNAIEPVDGGVVKFVAVPASNGASALLSASTGVIAAGQASITAAPDNVLGEYQVNAVVSGQTGSFDLTNTGTPFTTLIVNTTIDSIAPGGRFLSLREAVGFANFDTTGNATITFDHGVFASAQTITLALGTLELTNLSETESITGPANGLTLDGGGVSSVLQIDIGVTAAISGLTITHGSAGNGGGVSNLGVLSLTDCTISGNTAAQSGGGVYDGAYATATLVNCIISGNVSGLNGGGFSSGSHATATLIDCTVSGNSAYNAGGGLYLGANGTATLTNCTVSGNNAFEGGGIINETDATATLNSTTISGNTGGLGGGVLSFGTLALNQSTIAANDAYIFGGGLFSVNGIATTTLSNTIVAGNTASSVPDVTGIVTSLGNNLIGDASASSGWIASDLTGTTLAPINPLLAPLGNYGGPTETMPLLPGSPAIAAGNLDLIPPGATTDQRGEPRLLNGNVDIGAFESQGFTLTVVPGSTPQSADIGTTFANPLAVTVTANNAIEPVNGGVVNFVAHPAADGASAFFFASSAVISGGQASVTAAPNNATGEYDVDAVASGASASFDLTNTGTAFASLMVNTTVDSFTLGPRFLSLREAIAFANADTLGNATITFDPTIFGTAQTIDLTLGQLELDNLTELESIVSPSVGLTVDGGALSRVFLVDAGVTATISGMTIENGSADTGGGLLNFGTLTLTDCTVSGNTASTNGGGIANLGTLTLDHSTLSNNSSSGSGGGVFSSNSLTLTASAISDNTAGGSGGGVYGAAYSSVSISGGSVSGNSANLGGGVYSGYQSTAMLTDCTISGNSAVSGGGVLFGYYATATMTGCTISGNTAANDGGGVANAGTLAISDSKILNNTAFSGAGLYNTFYGSLTLTDCTVSDNTGTGVNNRGGGVTSHGQLKMIDSTVTGNTADLGGGVFNQYGVATLTRTTISGNYATIAGAGMLDYGATATLTDCTISGNSFVAGSTGGVGGGIYNGGTSTLTLTGSTISGNSAVAGGGLFNTYYSTAVLTNTTISGNTATTYGGGLYNYYYSSATLTNCTVSGNTAAADGGGVYNGYHATATLTNTTISGNTATVNGGGFYNGYNATATLINCTISGNSASGNGGGIYSVYGTTNIGNTIVALNSAATSGPDAQGTFVSKGNNLIGITDGSTGWVDSDLTGSAAQPLDPLLAPLGNYGGPTQTLALLPGSPAIDAGNNALIPSGVTTDQRGLPNNVNGTVDIGAFESSGFTIVVTSGDGQSTLTSTAFTDPLVVTVTANNPDEPVAGGVITFTPPSSGASATIDGIPATIDGSGNASVDATANDVGGAYSVSATASGITTPASFDLTNMWVSTFSGLTSPTIVYGTDTTEFTGHIGVGTAFPTGETVSVTLDSVTMTGIVDADGNFTVTFTTATLGVAGSPYTVTYAFAGSATFAPATDTTTTLTVTKADATVVVTPYTVTYDGVSHTATITSITGVNGETGDEVGTVTLDTTHTDAGTYDTDSWSFTGSANYNDIDSTTITDVIGKADATVVVTPYDVTYSGIAQTATITSITGVNGETGDTVGTVTLDTTHTDAGTYDSDSWSFTGAANYNDIASTTITDIIEKADATVVVTPYDVTYNGIAQTATVTSITGVNGETGDTVGTVTLDTTHTDAGTYDTDSWSFAGTANYNDIASTTITDVIEKADATVVVTPYSVTYDGSAHTATVTSITGVNGETGDEVGTVTLDTTHTDAGTYDSDSWSFAGTANYNDIASTTITDVIAKADATVVVTPYSVTYDGSAHTATVTSVTGVNGETGDEVGNVTLDTTHTNAGTYDTDSWSFTGTANYNDIASTTITDVIAKADATVVVTPYSVTYDGSAHTATVTSVTGVNGETGDSVGTVSLDTTHTNAGTYDSDSWSFTGAANYNDIASTTITDLIAKADATVVVTPYSVTYDGSAHTATVTSITGVNGETGDVVGTVTLDTTHTNVGTYDSDSWSFTGAANYNDIASTMITDSITTATLTITADNASKIYGTLANFGGTAFTESGLVAGNGDSITGVTETSAGAPVSAVAGSYDIVPSAATGSGLDNYTIVYVNGTLTVNPAGTVTTVSSSANPSVVGNTVTFTATVTPNSGAFDNGGTVQFAVDGTNFGTPVTPVNGQASIDDSSLGLGTHTITATYSGDANLNGSTGTLAGGQVVQLASGQVSGIVFRDFNINGHQDPGEPGLPGLTVFLDLNNSGVFVAGDPTATTDANGFYLFSFSGLQPGAYNVHEVLSGGALLSTPAGGSYTVMAGSTPSFPNLNFGDVGTSVTVPLTLPPTTPFPSQGNANGDYVQGIYRALLNRNADPGGLAFWTGILNGGSLTRLEVVVGIRNSQEHYTQEVDAFYHTLLNRSADPQGETFWVGQLQGGIREEQVTASFLNSPEFLDKGDKFFVDSMYNFILGRGADPVGEAFWLSQLGDDAAGNPVKPPSLTHAQVIADFIYSTESFERLVQGSYAVLLQRQTDVDGLNSWINDLQQGVPFATISEQLVASSEFFKNATAND